MILIDRQIKQQVKEHQMISEGYKVENINSISYDVTIFCIYDNSNSPKLEIDLRPGDTVFVKTLEKIKLPYDVSGRIVEKNSRMRQGLVVTGPVYQPGHETYMYLRVQNISTNIINLKQGLSIAQIMFESLSEIPDITYDKQINSSFNKENEYRGLGNYQEEYKNQIKKYSDKNKEEIETMTQRIYSNVLTIMGILVAIFSLLTLNFQSFSTSMTLTNTVIMNITLALCITLMMGIILIFINKAKNKWFLLTYITIIIILIVGLLICKIFT